MDVFSAIKIVLCRGNEKCTMIMQKEFGDRLLKVILIAQYKKNACYLVFFLNFQTELNCLSRIGAKLYHSDLQFERLDIDASLAAKIFEDNRFKSAQIPAIAAKSESGSKVTVYRMGDHVDITAGPLISSTSLIGRFTVTAVSAFLKVTVPMPLAISHHCGAFMKVTVLNPNT